MRKNRRPRRYKGKGSGSQVEASSVSQCRSQGKQGAYIHSLAKGAKKKETFPTSLEPHHRRLLRANMCEGHF